MSNRTAALGLLLLGIILAVGGIILAIIGHNDAEWISKTVAIIVGALVAIAGGSKIIHPD